MTTPLFLGIEVGGTKLQMGLGPGDGSILARERRGVVPADGAAGIWRQIHGALGPLLGQVGAERGAVGAVGIGFGGPVDAGRGVAIRSGQVAGWDGVSLVEAVRGWLGPVPVGVQNDADAAALAEARFGAGAGCSPVLYVNSGSGVGGGLVIEGRVYRGGSGLGALEFGHLRVFLDPEDLDPGAGRTVEAVASGWAIGRAGARLVEAARGAPGPAEGSGLVALCGGAPDKVTAALVAEAAGRGDAGAVAILDRATTAFAQGLAHAVTLLAPRRIVLGGGVSLADEALWLGPIRRKLEAGVFGPFRGTFDVVPAGLGEDVVVHGALALARDAWMIAADTP